jgi:nitrite reductase/ring-hydroxylating ferredoxin subunit
MIKRNHFALLAVPLLALTVSCASVVDAVRDILPSDASGGRAAELPPPTGDMQAVESPSQTENLPVIGISSRSTPDHIWAEPVIDGGGVSIPLAVATLGDHFHFEVPGPSGPIGFIAYQVDGQFHIRASVCPSCGGTPIDYGAGELVCSSCGEAYNLGTGAALNGGQGYPAGSISACVIDEYLTSTLHSLTLAYERTAAGEETLYDGPAVPDAISGRGCSRK